MMKKLWILSVAVLLFTAAPVESADRYVGGLSIHFENWPSVVKPSDVISATVRVTNENKNSVDGLLRTYVYGFKEDISYPPPNFWDVVLLNEGGWYANEIQIHVDNGETKSYTLKLKLKSDVVTVSSSGAKVRLRTRLKIIENETSVNLAPPDTKEILLAPRTLPPEFLSIKVFTGIFVGG